MAKIKTPSDPQPSDEVVGPNYAASVDPGFSDPFRNDGGDVGRVRRVTGKPSEKRDSFGFPIRK